MKNKATVVVFGREYNMVSEESPEHMLRVGHYLDEQAKKLSGEGGMGVSTVSLVTLTALNVADDYIKLKDTVNSVVLQNEQLAANLKSASLENAMVRKENGKLTEQLENALQEVKKLRAQIDRPEKNQGKSPDAGPRNFGSR